MFLTLIPPTTIYYKIFTFSLTMKHLTDFYNFGLKVHTQKVIQVGHTVNYTVQTFYAIIFHISTACTIKVGIIYAVIMLL
jgi:hypothetical protein